MRPCRAATGTIDTRARDRERDGEIGTRSATRTPPATLAYTSAPPIVTPARCVRAPRAALRAGRCRAPARTGAASASHVGATSACTSTSSGRAPSSTGATTDPEAPVRRSARNSAEASGTSVRPRSLISNRPSSSVEPKRCFSAWSMRNDVVTIAVEREHRVDDVLEHARPGEAAVLGDVADEQGGDVALLGQAHEPVRALAHLGHRSRLPGRSGSSTVWIESIASTSGGELVDVREHVRAATSPRRGAGRERARRPAQPGAAPARADSSALTSRHRAPRAAMTPSAWSSSVLLPMPGSPPSRVTDPATRPPPSTRSSSADAGGAARAHRSGSTSAMGTGRAAPTGNTSGAVRADVSPGSSTRVPHDAAVGAAAQPAGGLASTLVAPVSNTCSGHPGIVPSGCDTDRGPRCPRVRSSSRLPAVSDARGPDAPGGGARPVAHRQPGTAPRTRRCRRR